MSVRLLPPASVAFRRELLGLLDRSTPLPRFFYVSSDTSICICAACGAAMTVRFAGRAARAD